MVAGAVLNSLVTYEYLENDQNNLSDQTLSRINNQQQYEYFHV
jgi:hypothetical protein